MGTDNKEANDKEFNASTPSASSSDQWKNRIFFPTILAGVAGAGVGLLSKHRRSLGLAIVTASYATNFAIVTGFYCCSREFAFETRKTGPDDLWSSWIAGFGTGAILGRLQGGTLGAARYSFMFAVAGTTADYAILKFKDFLNDRAKMTPQYNEHLQKNEYWLKLPEWFPINILDEEALAAKRAQEEEFLAQRARIRSLREEES